MVRESASWNRAAIDLLVLIVELCHEFLVEGPRVLDSVENDDDLVEEEETNDCKEDQTLSCEVTLIVLKELVDFYDQGYV